MPSSDIITLQTLSDKLSQWRQPDSNELYAIVDMGSNGIRFSITSLAPPFSRLLTPIFAKRAAISLFDALKPSASGLIFPDETIAEVADTLAGFYRLAIAHHVIPQHIFVFATEAMRRADNAGKMLGAISDATDGLGVQILEPAVETLFGAVMGSRSGVVNVPKGALFLDLGGGSVQMTWVDTSVDDYELKAATAGSSMPYGAAKTMRIFEEMSVQQQHVEIGNLRSGMKTVYGVLCSQFPALNAIKTAYEKGENAKVNVYMCGGGFRGYGRMLMHSDSINMYPIASTHTYVADGEHFKQTAKMLEINQEYQGKIFGMSKRRRQQFPAIVTVLDAFIAAVPNIGQVTFCGGSNREGALMMMLPKEVRESNPMEILADLKDDERSIMDAALELLRGSVPPDVPLSDIPTILIHGLGYLFVQQIWKRRGYKSEVNSAFALHDAIQRNSESPGFTHLDRALLGLTLCSYWDGKLTEADSKLYQGLCGIARRHSPQSIFWSQYLAAIAMVIVEIVPVAPVSSAELLRALKFESNLDETEDKSVVILRIGIAKDYVKGVDVEELAESIRTRTKNKTEPGPSKVKVQIYTRSQQ